MAACEDWAKKEHEKIVKQEIQLAKNHSGHFDEHLHLSANQKKDASNTMKEVRSCWSYLFLSLNKNIKILF